jgi:hypothetical protein
MEELEKAFYEVKFENEFLKSKGNAFQDFFNNLMSRAHKSDYMPCRPWGNQGDLKNDGFLKSERCLFQVYAPNDMEAKKAIEKIRIDFEGAKIHWNELFIKWVFVHNAYNGIPAHVQKEILKFERNNTGIKLEIWGLEELRDVFRLIPKEDLESWFGYAPNIESKSKVRFEDIQVVLETIATQKLELILPIKQVPSDKIKRNQLSDYIATLIKEGMTKSSLVESFFNKWYDPTFGEKIAASFRNKYDSLRGFMSPNEIFYKFQAWVGGTERGTAEHEMAVLAVLAYYFERCDFFEEPLSQTYDSP